MTVARLIAFAVVFMTAGMAHAAENALDLLDAKVSYQADFYVRSPQGTYNGNVWHAPGRERREFDTSGGVQAVLLRRDTDAAYLMKPSARWYVSFGLKAAADAVGGLDSMVIQRHKVGTDTISGQPTTRYKVTAAAPDGQGNFNGDAWFNADGIMVKAAGTVTGSDGRSMPVETGLANVVLTKVDETMFAIPSGWFGVDLKSVPADRLRQTLESLKPMLNAGGGSSRR